MKLLLIVLAVIGSSALADSISPDGQLLLRDTGDHGQGWPTIEGRWGSSFFSSFEKAPELEGFVQTSPFCSLWSPDSRMVAVGFRAAKYIMETLVLRREKDTFKSFSLPISEDDSQIIPIRWEASDLLVVEVSGPRGGKAEGDNFFVYTMMCKFDPKAKSFKAIKKGSIRYPFREHR